MKIITLTSDFGTNDWFVGTMKGVILGINPRVHLVDLAHGIPSGDIRAGALTLMLSCDYFPPGTIHIAVVDPGVGSNRSPIAIETDSYLFIGPDNGVLSMALSDENVKRIHRLTNDRYFQKPVSQTFHGRDIFAPVAAYLAKSVPLARFGPAQPDYVRLEMEKPKVEVGRIRGEVIYIDRFGNAITNVTVAHIGDIDPHDVSISMPGRKSFKLGRFYQEAREGEPIGVVSSSGFLEIAVNAGNAAKDLRLRVGSPLTVDGKGRSSRSYRPNGRGSKRDA